MKRLLILHCKMAFQVQRALREHLNTIRIKRLNNIEVIVQQSLKSTICTHNYHDRELILLLNDYIEEMNHFIEDIEKVNYKEITFQPTNHQLNQFNHIIQVGYLRNLLNTQYQSQLLTCHHDFHVMKY
ncbi:AraC family transcriptional regulator [Staphylococcus aureus]|uniref:AraC family transcriptional regulator n=1 Tax=Staphylococcus aureus TaxID=1280 RepID=A0A380DPP9_STAAU|nr:AraC family transcriptional regulator [Staphylococcus aureus]